MPILIFDNSIARTHFLFFDAGNKKRAVCFNVVTSIVTSLK